MALELAARIPPTEMRAQYSKSLLIKSSISRVEMESRDLDASVPVVLKRNLAPRKVEEILELLREPFGYDIPRELVHIRFGSLGDDQERRSEREKDSGVLVHS